MIKWTTPTLVCTIDPPNITFDYILFKLRGTHFPIERKIMPEEVEDGVFTVRLTQEETGSFKCCGDVAEVQLNFIRGEERFATNIEKLIVTKNLIGQVIDNG